MYTPGPRSMVHMRDFPSADALWAFLASFDDDSPETLARYKAEFFAWKQPAMMTYMMDEQGQNNPIGTGHGVILSSMLPTAELIEQLQLWAVAQRGGADAAADAATPRSFDDVARDVATRTTAGGKPALAHDKLAAFAWRGFRRRLDQCVHYAECRLCELVTLLTT